MPVDSLPFVVPLVTLNALCQRAVDYRRGLVTDPMADLQHGIVFSVPHRDLRREPDDWFQISNLIDRIAGGQARILWHPETDRLRLHWSDGRPGEGA